MPLAFVGGPFEAFPDLANDQPGYGQQDQDKYRKLGADTEKDGQVCKDRDGVAEKHFEGTHNRPFHFLHIGSHP